MLSSAKLQRALALLLLLGVLLISPVAVYINEFLAVDACVDSGGIYNYSTGECDFVEHPYIPFSSRYPRVTWMIRFLAPVGGGVALAGVAIVTTRRSN